MNNSHSITSVNDFQIPENQVLAAAVWIMQAGLLLRREGARNLCAPDARVLRGISDELRQLLQPLLRIARAMKSAEDDPEHVGSIAQRELAKMAAGDAL